MLYRHGGSFMYRTIFVTGASGFIGSNLCKRILKEDSEWCFLMITVRLL